jgi:hypothetical protein
VRELWQQLQMPALSAPLAGFALGAGLFWSAATSLRRPIRSIAGHTLLIAAILGLLAFAPAVALLINAEPDWAYAYLVPARLLPRWLGPWLVLLSGLGVPLGFGQALRASQGQPAFVQRWFWAPLALAVLPLVLAAPRLRLAATFEQFHGDFGGRALLDGPLGYLLAWLLIALAAATWFARRCLDWLAAGAADGS